MSKISNRESCWSTLAVLFLGNEVMVTLIQLLGWWHKSFIVKYIKRFSTTMTLMIRGGSRPRQLRPWLNAPIEIWINNKFCKKKNRKNVICSFPYSQNCELIEIHSNYFIRFVIFSCHFFFFLFFLFQKINYHHFLIITLITVRGGSRNSVQGGHLLYFDFKL